jgi:hypothetical protein
MLRWRDFTDVFFGEEPTLFRAGSPWRWVFAVGGVGLALAVTLGVKPLQEQPPTLLFFAAVILTSWYAGMRAGLLASLLSIITLDYFFVAPLYSLEFELLDLVDLFTFAGAAWLISTLQARWRSAHRALVAVEQEMELARRIQQRLFPTSSPALPGWDIAGVCHPANATGGDFFDYFPMAPSTLGIVVGDVSGHGLGPALVTALLHAYLRTLARTQSRPDEILTHANRLLCEDMHSGLFATVVFACLDPESRRWSYAGAGHEAYLLDVSGEMTRLPSSGLPLGISPAEDVAGGGERTLQPGQVVLLISDGILESASPDNEMFGLARAVDLVRRHRAHSAQEIAELLCRAAQSHAHPGPQTDDMTVVVIKVGTR